MKFTKNTYQITFVLLLQIIKIFSYQSVGLQGMEVTEGLIAFFPLDKNNVVDIITGKRGTPQEVSMGKNRFNDYQYSFYFDGKYDYIDLPFDDFTHLDLQNLSITAWIKYYDFKNIVVLDNRAGARGNEYGYHFGTNEEGYLKWFSGDNSYNYCKNYSKYQEQKGEKDRHDCYAVSKNSQIKEGWNHVGISKNGSELTFFLNGQKTEIINLKHEKIRYDRNARHRYIGTSQDEEFWDSIYKMGDKEYSKGVIDDIRVYKRPITESEINTIYNYRPSFSCDTYYSESSKCASCKGDRILTSSKDCICPLGKFDDQKSFNCTPCSQKCKSCSLKADICDTCSDPLRDPKNNCECVEGYFDDGINESCQECPPGCKTCQSNTKCDSCLISEFPRFGDLCECPEGTFHDEKDDKCNVCDIQCQSCQGSSGNCTKCKVQSGLFRYDRVPLCPCQNGYFDVKGQCEACASRCKSCSNKYVCDSCYSKNDVLPYCVQKQQGFW